jgi:nitroimidazol reductase NimA-like FMN-containing flavoprotein (pyridoxamine 5'-phosphate oxidase superfamily)
MSLKMTKEEREKFLADLHIGIISLARPDRAPLTVPIWYDYEPGGNLWIVTEPGSAKGKLLSVGTRVSFCVQNESLPYKYVTVEGPVVAVDDADTERDLAPIAKRYLGEELGAAYVEETGGGPANVRVTIKPETWLTVDYDKR